MVVVGTELVALTQTKRSGMQLHYEGKSTIVYTSSTSMQHIMYV